MNKVHIKSDIKDNKRHYKKGIVQYMKCFYSIFCQLNEILDFLSIELSFLMPYDERS